MSFGIIGKNKCKNFCYNLVFNKNRFTCVYTATKIWRFIFQAYGLNNLQNLIKFQFLLYYKNIVQEKYTYIKN